MRSFSLVEITVSIIVVTVMASIAYPVARIQLVREKESYLKSYLTDMRKAITDFKDANPSAAATGAYVAGDGDGDGLIDEEVNDGIDNDGDGLVDEDVAPPGYPTSLKALVTNHFLRRIYTSPFSSGTWQYRISISEDIYQKDDFNSSMGTWTAENGSSWILSSGELYLNVQNANAVIADGNNTWKNYYIEAYITPETVAAAGDYLGIAMRYDSAGPDMYVLKLLPDSNELRLDKIVGGLTTNINTWPQTIDAGGQYYCKLQVESNVIIVWFNDPVSPLGSFNDNSILSGKPCMVGVNATGYFDNVCVSAWKNFVNSDKEVSESDDDIFDIRLFSESQAINGTYYYTW